MRHSILLWPIARFGGLLMLFWECNFCFKKWTKTTEKKTNYKWLLFHCNALGSLIQHHIQPAWIPGSISVCITPQTLQRRCIIYHPAFTHLEQRCGMWKLLLLGFNPIIWSLDLHTDHQNTITQCDGSLHGCVLSPLLWILMTHDFVCRHKYYLIMKFTNYCY